MKKTCTKKILSLALCAVLVAAIALTATGCRSTTKNEPAPAATVQSTHAGTPDDPIALGQGAKTFTFTSTDVEGKDTVFSISTDKATVGEALTDAGVIAGDNGQYGLYVKTVNGLTLDYDKDKKYWAFYVNGEYASSGVDTTNIEDGVSYAFKAE